MNTQIDRRSLFRLLLALGATVAVNQKPALGAGADCSATIFGNLDLAAIRELGREYLAQRPADNALESITKQLASSLNEAETAAQLRTQMLADFAAGRIVNLDGWFVSETEGCVFAALSRCDSQPD